jgi:hypothetical protein
MKNLPNKIKNLNKIKKLVKVPNYFYFNFKLYQKKKKIILNTINKKFKKIIIRSASFLEDNNISNAGKYLSVPDIKANNEIKIDCGIQAVFNSYGKNKNTQFVLIQEYIKNPEIVGVIFTADPKNGSPFITINFNDSGHTDLITSGKSNGKIVTFFKYISKSKLDRRSRAIKNIIDKLEKKFLNFYLDIEFLIFKKKIYILQVRRLKVKESKNINFKKSLLNLEKKILKMTNENSHLYGEQRYFSTMTDWNPAEIIGLKPKTLAISLYQSLITNEIWSESRVDLGYKDVTKIPLLYSFLGTPYIDLKTDINSFLINSLSEKIQKKLIKFYFEKFKKFPYHYYDKIESELVINCISINPLKYKKILKKSKLSKNEINKIIEQYTKLTNNVILKLDENIKKYKYGEKLFSRIKKTKNSTLNKIFLFHNICKNYGTLPFANIARMSFIAIEFLNSFVELKIINKNEKILFLENSKSISSEMNEIFAKNKKVFLTKYGHLRPNTYEISNANYKENFKEYFKKITLTKKISKNFKFKNKHKILINKFLKLNNFNNIDANQLLYFIENSIYHREASKLFFTKIIDEIFFQLKFLFKRIKLNQNDIEYLNINKILTLYEKFSNEHIVYELKKDIEENRKIYKFNQNFNLPNIIKSKEDIYFHEEKNASPTFITNKIIISKFVYLKNVTKKLNIENKIICIENADPGYDFIFNHKIKGLITAFGGPNSHMSIRCHEFEVPAVIGIGEKKFQQLIKNNTLYLNCEKRILSGL